MEQTKPRRQTSIFDYWDANKRQKITDDSHSSSRTPMTQFEDFSNELFYEIFEFLDFCDVYKAFYTLNIRFQNLLTDSTLPIKINSSSLSKSTFQRYYRQIIMPNKHRIQSLRLSNPFIVDLIFSPVRIASKFLRLETLIFDNIKSKYLVNILNHLASLTSLSSLVIMPVDHVHNPYNFYRQIFRLPVLKYCKMSLKGRVDPDSLPQATHEFSPIEHLVIENNFDFNELNILLSYVPQLRRLSLWCLDESSNRHIEPRSIKLNNLTHVSLRMVTINFNQLELMIKNLFHQVQVLHISPTTDRAYLDANRWERLILSSMPYLRIFNFQYTNFVENDDNNNIQLIYNGVFNQFSSAFWYERKWFFTYHFYFDQHQEHINFYSTGSYRKKYTIYRRLGTKICPPYSENNVDSVDHVDIQGDQAIMSCAKYFCNATKLTLSYSFGENRVWLGIILNCIIPLKQLTTLVIHCDNFRLEQLIKLLRFTPNIHTLTLDCESINKTDSVLIRQSETFRLVSNTNTITNVTIKERYTSENIQVLVNLCPRLEHLIIDVNGHYLESTLRFILSKCSTNLRYLFYLCTKNTNKSMVEILKTAIESEELLDNYSIKLIDSELYLWW